ncbi:MAG: gamma-glutamylcyclotransferase [Leptolyngbya sp. SIO3F4]|nr:gamma-glutamylcyclotransferase [Leptolyngbya sp. SIO3F4]
MGTIDVFVYGTLKPGGIYHQQYCLPYLKQVQPAQVKGSLYDLPELGYPVMTPGENWVKGYLLTLNAVAMSGLDELEGYDRHGLKDYDYFHIDEEFVEEYISQQEEDYVRQRTTVFNLVGQSMGEAWIYIMTKPPAGAVYLVSGEWMSGG